LTVSKLFFFNIRSINVKSFWVNTQRVTQIFSLISQTWFSWCAVCHLWITIWLVAATATIRLPICCLRSAPHNERHIEMYKPVFLVICGLSQAFSRDLRLVTIVYTEGQRIKFLFILLNVNFSNILALWGTIRTFLNVVAAHIEGLRYPPCIICSAYAYLFDTHLMCQYPFKKCSKNLIQEVTVRWTVRYR
jgi:hypothetical protein